MSDFEKYTVDEIRDIVEYDRPDDLRRQALAWTEMAELLDVHAIGLDTESAALARSWTGRAANSCRDELARAETAMREAADTAASNAHGWAQIAEIVGWAREEVLRVHALWLEAKAVAAPSADQRYVPDDITVEVGEPRDVAALRQPFDEAAREVMDSAAEAIGDQYHRFLAVPARYPLPTAPLPADSASGLVPLPSAEGASDDDDVFFGEGGPGVSPLLQSGTAAPAPMAGGGAAPGPGAVSGASGGGPMLASTPMRPAAADGFAGTGPSGRSPMDGVQVSRAPKPYTGDDGAASRLVRPKEPEPIDSEVERLSRREPDPDDDDPWGTTEPTVPGVITDSTPEDPPFHDPGTVIGGR